MYEFEDIMSKEIGSVKLGVIHWVILFVKYRSNYGQLGSSRIL